MFGSYSKEKMHSQSQLFQFSCTLCNNFFPSHYLLIRHVFLHISTLSCPFYICTYCSVLFKNSRIHQHHKCINRIISKGPLSQRSCSLCALVFPSQYILMSHVFRHLSTVSHPSYVCKYCSEVFKGSSSLQLHKCNTSVSPLSTMSPVLRYRDVTQNNYICEHQSLAAKPFNNNKTDRTVSNSQNNVLNFSPVQPPSRIGLQNDEIQNRISLGPRSFTCNVCCKSFRWASALKIHERIHTGERPFACEICAKSFMHSYQLSDHKRIHLGECPYVCVICGKQFARSYGLKIHGRIHTGERPFTCEVCGISFVQSSNLRSHRSIHTGLKPFACKYCGKSFLRYTSLRSHTRIHSGEQPFSCEICRMSFSHCSSLKNHTRIHSGERPFVCEHCGKSFALANYLKNHNRIHTGDRLFVCKHCGKSYAQSGTLLKHTRRCTAVC